MPQRLYGCCAIKTNENFVHLIGGRNDKYKNIKHHYIFSVDKIVRCKNDIDSNNIGQENDHCLTQVEPTL